MPNSLFTEPSAEELDRARKEQPEFRGNLEHLVYFLRLTEFGAGLPRSTRIKSLREWRDFNTRKSDATTGHDGRPAKGPLRTEYARLDLRGLSVRRIIIGNVDLAGANLEGASFHGCTLTGATFRHANLRNADLTKAWLLRADFTHSKLHGANFGGALARGALFRDCATDQKTCLDETDLQGADLSRARLAGVSMRSANLQLARLMETDLRGADITGAWVFGVAAWNPSIDESTTQEELVVTPKKPPISVNRARAEHVVAISEPVPELTTSSLEHAHLIHLMSNPDLHELLTSVTSKGVLLLGRFTGEQAAILEGLKNAIRSRGYLPLKFDFAKPEDRTLKETVLTLAGLSRFIVADLTDPQSIPLELTTIVKDFKIPVVPLIRSGNAIFSMFHSLAREYADRVMEPLEYESQEDLLGTLDEAIVGPALAKAEELDAAKKQRATFRRTGDYGRS